ncbi:MAG: hypothetical protein Q4D79_15425 [Propionibacteriaceae bacterium]|nr:hypothetical protein [Propionibacteriaceae bacterium]
MTINDLPEALRNHVVEGDAVFSVVRHVRRPFWKELLDLLFAGYIFTTAQDIKDTVDGLFFLIASDGGRNHLPGETGGRRV